MNAIKLENVILVKDKIINVRVEGKEVHVFTTVGETVLTYGSEMDAQLTFENIYKQLNVK